jgi:hypothetical protein
LAVNGVSSWSNGGETDAMKVPITQSREERSARASVCGSCGGSRGGRVVCSGPGRSVAWRRLGVVGLGGWAPRRETRGPRRGSSESWLGPGLLSRRCPSAAGHGAGALGCAALQERGGCSA